MRGLSRRSLIQPLHSALPHGEPFDVAVLKRVGVSAKQAARYVESGWLVRLGHGVYSFAGDELDLHSCIKLMQTTVNGLHVAGKSALALQGIRHNLGRERILLWGDSRFELPEWFTSRFPARYSYSKLFDWPNETLSKKSLTTPPGVTKNLKVSVPERAVLEMLSEVGNQQGMEEARNLFDGLRNLRQDTLGDLLACCTSVKAVRLFLTWARETQVVEVDTLLQNYTLPVGSDKRWISRLKDGTLLSLKPHG